MFTNIIRIIKDIMKSKLDEDVEKINKRIKDEICYNTISLLSDENLMDEYMNCNSVKNEITILGNILNKYLDGETKNKIIQEYLLNLIPAGTKGVIRGNKFNIIIKKYIIGLKLDLTRFEICFEKKCEHYPTSEIPDWYIIEKLTNKIIIGMNQLDLWGGGQQVNRGSKYLINNVNNTNNSKLLCVVCNEVQIKRKTNKIFQLFKVGFENNTLCYLNNLSNIINDYFELIQKS